MKTRMTIDDVHAIISSIRSNALGMRVTNLYDVDGKTYLFKLHAPPPHPKCFLLMESGIRVHTTKYARDKPSIPNTFTMKLRKHLRGKRLVDVQQIGGDRVVDFQFGEGEMHEFHLILELYSSGNLILTDHTYTILSLLRVHRYNEDVKVAVRQIYPMETATNEKLHEEFPMLKDEELDHQVTEIYKWLNEQSQRYVGKKKKTLKQAFLLKGSGYEHLGPTVLEHCFTEANIVSSMKIIPMNQMNLTHNELKDLIKSLEKGKELMMKLKNKNNNQEEKMGYILLKEENSENFEEFVPMLYAQHMNKNYLSFPTFDEAVDEYFSQIESQLANDRQKALKAASHQKYANIEREQAARIESLEKTTEQAMKQAQLIEQYSIQVDEVLLVLNSALTSGMNWEELEELVQMEQENGNPVALRIHELHFETNQVSILFYEDEDDEEASMENDTDDDDEEEDDNENEQVDQQRGVHVIRVNLSLSALANARELYTEKKRSVVKIQKTKEATEAALARAQTKVLKSLTKVQNMKNTIQRQRKIHWFEKFRWFISSENYLIIGGRDAQQNELLVKKYLRPMDVYVHADVHGAMSCIIRNISTSIDGKKISKKQKTYEKPIGFPIIPVQTLEEAGQMTVCHSAAWASNTITSAWWVYANQVSKTAPTGEYLVTGSFMIRGKKNFLHPSRLEMGMGILFRLADESIKNHLDERRCVIEEEKEIEEIQEEHDQEDQEEEQEEEEEEEEEEQEEVKKQIQEEEKDEIEKIEELDDEKERKHSSISIQQISNEEENDMEGTIKEKKTLQKKRLSARERRILRKGIDRMDLTSVIEERKQEKQDVPPPSPCIQIQSKPTKKDEKRGTRGKKKKMKKKYADQDEEDRRIRMIALGNPLPEVKNDEENEKKQEEKKNVIETTTKKKKEKKNEIEDDENTYEIIENEQEELKSLTGQPRTQIEMKNKIKLKENQEKEDDEEEKDILLYALPVCAPYSTLSSYKYRAKLTPGNLKKGKASRQLLDYFLRMNTKKKKNEMESTNEELVDIEHELMKCINENEMIASIMGNIKVSAPGLYDKTTSSKAKKKKKKGKGQKN